MEARNFGDPPCKRSPSLSLVWLEADCDGYLTSLPAATIPPTKIKPFSVKNILPWENKPFESTLPRE